MTNRENIPLPSGICVECQHEGRTYDHPAGRLAIYCPHHRAGGMLQPTTDGASLWTIWTPVTREEFEASLAHYSARVVAALGSPGATLQ